MAVSLIVGCGAPTTVPLIAPPTGSSTSPANVRSDPLAYLPANSDLIVVFDASRLRTSEVWPLVERRIRFAGGDSLASFEQICELDLLATITSFAAGIYNAEEPRPDSILVVRGIPRERLEACARNLAMKGIAITSDREGIAIEARPDSPAIVVRLLDETLAVVGIGPTMSRAKIQSAIDGGAPLRSSKEFRRDLERVDVSAACWVLARGHASLLSIADVGARPETITASVVLAQGASLRAHVAYANPGFAPELAGRIGTHLERIRTMLAKGEVHVEENAVALDVVIEAEQVTLLLDSFGAY